jgi:hypothetical protein
MTVRVSIDVEDVLSTVSQMLWKIDHFKRVDIGQGLSEWQTEEMHRHRPFTMRYRAKGLAITKIRPHSLARMERMVGVQNRIVGVRKKGGWKLRKRKLKIHFRPRTSTRPILREELFVALEERMTRLLADRLRWSYFAEKSS